MAAGTARPRKSPEQKAQEALDVAAKRLTKAQEKLAGLEAGIETAKAEVARAERFHNFAASNPDLPTTVQHPA